MGSDLDEQAREHMGRLMLLIVSVLMLNLGFKLWTVLPPANIVGVVLTIYTYGTALGLLVAALVDLDLDQHGYKIAGWCVYVILSSAVTLLWLRAGTDFGTDALLFSRYSVDLLLSGENPFAASMAPAASVYDASILHVTPQIDGSSVTSLSYPAGMVWAFVPQAVTGVGGLNLSETLLLGVGFVLVFLVLESPPSLALLPLIVMLGSRNLIWASTGGILDVLWLVPLLVAMRYWHREQYGAAAVAYGLAAGTKQTVWPIAPALAIWLWNDAADRGEFLERARTCIRNGLAGFLALNLPFIVWNPTAWVQSVILPAESGAEMVHQGVGVTLTSVAGVYALPKNYYALLTVASFVVAIGVYALYWDHMKWVAWILPPVVLFWYYRSLNSYFTWFLPVAYYALLCHLGLRRQRWTTGRALTTALARYGRRNEQSNHRVSDR